MTITNSTFSLFKGESRELQISNWDNDENEPLQLEGATIQFELYREPTHTLILQKDNTGLSVSVIDYVNGIVQVALTSSDTQFLVFGNTYVYYLRVTNSENQVGVTAKGTLNLTK